MGPFRVCAYAKITRFRISCAAFRLSGTRHSLGPKPASSELFSLILYDGREWDSAHACVASRCGGQDQNDLESDWFWATTFRGSALFGTPGSEYGLKTLPFQFVFDSDGGIGIAVDSNGHTVERTGAAFEYKHREIPLTQGLC